MEEIQNEEQQQQETINPVTPLAPPPMAPEKPKRNMGILILGAVLLIIIIIVGIFVVRSSGTQSTPSPTPETQGLTTLSTPLPSVAPIDKSKVTILVQNGTGIAGEAAYLQGVLKSMGYSEIAVGNADNTTTETTVTYGSNVDKSVSDEITQKLTGIYQTVNTKTSSTQAKDVVILTGLRKGQTPLPSATPAATPEASASPTASPTSTPTSTP